MTIPVNAQAPDLPLQLSPQVAQTVADTLASGSLSPYACADADAIRRESNPRDADSPLRPAFVRDAEKIIHMPAYNRLAGKTQVFSFESNDDISRRGLHVQLVARVARDIGRALGLNLDLIEAIALGHDIGHTPFGHAGERFLNAAYHDATGRWFHHNVQSVRVLDVLYGRNLSLQTLDGVLCHNGEYEQREFRTSNLAGFDGPDGFDAVVEDCWSHGDLAMGHLCPCTLEGCVVRLSDIIAYVGKDRQDAIVAKMVDPSVFADGMGGAYNAWALAAFVTDVVENSVGKSQICMSEAGFTELGRAKRENYEKIYLTSEVAGSTADSVGTLFSDVYGRLRDDLIAGDEDSPIFRHHIKIIERNLGYYGRTYDWSSDPNLTVVDYIASMTDDYFVALASHLFGEKAAAFPYRPHFD